MTACVDWRWSPTWMGVLLSSVPSLRNACLSDLPELKQVYTTIGSALDLGRLGQVVHLQPPCLLSGLLAFSIDLMGEVKEYVPAHGPFPVSL